MKFIYPYFLFALATIAIPIIIHLFNFRRFKTVYFSNVEFLKNIKKESKRKSKLKQLLILLSRILAIICLVLAFSQPYIPVDNREQANANQAVAVYIDNSFSMNSQGQQGQLLETARSKAIEIAREYKPGTQFRLITNNMLPMHMNFMNSEQFIQQVTEIEASPNVVPLSMIYSRLKESFARLEGKNDYTIYFLSDFQREITDIGNIENDSSVWTYFLPLFPQASGNLYIDSCWFETPSRKLNEEEELYVKIINRSGEDYQDLPLKFYLNDSLKSLTNFSIPAQGEVEAILKFTNQKSGFRLGRVELTDYPVTHDNNYFIAYKVQPEVNVLAIYDENSPDNGLEYIRALFSDDEYTTLDVMGNQSLQISRFGDYNTIIILNLSELPSGFANELEQTVSNGTSIILFPALNGDIQSYNHLLNISEANIITGIDTLPQAIAGIALDNPLYDGIFRDMEENVRFPEINGHLKFSSQTRIAESKLLWFMNNDKALSTVAHGDGFIHVFSFPLNKLNQSFARDIIFVPTIYSLVLNSIPRQNISYTIGKDQYILLKQNSLPENYSQLVIKGKNNETEFIPEVSANNKNKARIGLTNMISEAGFYNITAENNIVSTVALNYNRTESDLRYFSIDELETLVSQPGFDNITVIRDTGPQFSEIFDEIQNGKQLWKLFLMLALLFIALEAFIIRFWK